MKLAVIAPQNRPCGIADYALSVTQALPADFQTIWAELPDALSSRRWHDVYRRANEAEIIHVHYEYGLFHSVRPFRNRFGWLMRRLTPPKIVTLHDALPELKPRWGRPGGYRFPDLLRDLAYWPFFKKWESRQYALADHLIAHTPELVERVRQFRDPSAVSLVPHPIPGVRQKWVCPKNPGVTLITLGFVKAHKGYEEILPLLADRPTWRWIIAGGPQTQQDRQYLARLQSQLEALALSGRVTITGYLSREQMESLCCQAHLAVFPYRWSSGSGAISWAIGLGLPVVATDLPLTKAYKKADAGLELLPNDRPGLWGTLLDALLEQPEKLNRLAWKNQHFSSHNGFTVMAGAVARLSHDLRRG
jgi:glycosyltransferase involved in cell wall biosynthesis